ncbi:ribosome-dependent ATPase [Cricetibacter osteomyelitidis]|uniref:Ribosome-dependent ATPase n=1 Tax=Cricetibacter osteomyelitidis TaxID=1521931 RepID=A0A4V2T2F7_9PAST|nr:ribosome-associated ATPase/putative transporter RbbA [Cricetibacter osteomyelitidis]TCP97273.1 ribosome-dependent ATPase [Cricetibacter osteomyelitidis]
MNAVSITNLSHRYGDTQALNMLSLNIKQGATVGLVGPDGVGKSTLLSLIAGVKIIQTGQVTVLGGNIAEKSSREKQLPRIAFMPQGLGHNLYPTLTISENIEFHANLFGLSKKALKARTTRLLQATGLTPFADRAAGKLSGGMKQKLSLCCALVHNPDLLILDEPTTGVDPLSRRQFWALVDNLRAESPNMTVIVATAYIDEAQSFEYLIAMDDGKILVSDKTENVLKTYRTLSLEDAYVQMLPQEKRGSGEGLNLTPFVKDPNLPPAMEAEGLTKQFGDFTAVNNVSFKIEKGEIFGFLGSNGCGKSTTMKMLTGLLEPTSGKAQLLGKSIAAGSNEIKKRVGYMSQAFSLYEELTVRENLQLHARLYEIPEQQREQFIAESLNQFDLEKETDLLPSSLPLGIRQRLQLAAACLHKPEVLILDEPTSGVDPAARDMFWRYLLRLSRDDRITIFVSTHFMNEALRCDRISFMHKGTVLGVGTPQELIDYYHSENLEQAFIQYLLVAEPENNIEINKKSALSTENNAKNTETTHKSAVGFLYFFTMLWAFAVREFKELARDKIRLFFGVFGPIILLTATGWAVSFDVNKMNLGVYDQDQSQESRALVEAFSGTAYFSVLPNLKSRSELNLILKKAQAEVVIDIPPNYGKDLLSGKQPEIGFFINGTQPVNTATVKSYITGILQNHITELTHSTTQPVINVVPRLMYNPDSRSVNAITPSLLMMIMMMIPAMMTALGVVREREIGSITNLYSSPANVAQFLMGKQLPYIVMGVLNYVALMLLTIFWFDVPVKGSFLVLTAGALLLIWAATSFGLLISSVVTSQAAAIVMTAIGTLVPTMNFSGMLYPVSSMADWAQILSNAFPTTWFKNISTGSFTKGIALADMQGDFIALLVFVIIYLAIACIKLKKQEP